MPTKDDVARLLADLHFGVEPGMVAIYRVIAAGESESRPDEPIKLLEVSEDTVPAGIMPLHFAPHPPSGISFPSVIMEITPQEFADLEAGRITLPKGWKLGQSLPRPRVVEDVAG